MKRRNLVLAAPAVLGTGLLGGLHSAAHAAGTVIRFGQSAAFTGGQANYGRDVRDGITAAFAAASKADAAKGVRYELVTLDDGGLTPLCTQNVNTLIEGGVSAMIGMTSGVGIEACLPTITTSQMALIGAATGSMAIRASSAAYHVRAGYDLEYRRMVNYVKDFGMSRVGVVFLSDHSPVNMAAMNNAIKMLSKAPVETVAVDRNATSFQGVAQRLIDAKLDLVLFAVNAKPIASIINHMMEAKYPGLFYASSFAGQDLVETLTERKQSCVMSMVVPRPNAGGANVVSSCKQDLAAAVPGSKLGMTTLEGYIAGRIAVEAARSALRTTGGERVSRSRMRDAVAGTRADLGGYRVEFAPGINQGSQYVDLVAIDRWGRFVG